MAHRFKKLSLLWFRNHKKLEIDCDSGFVVIQGLNGVGKTNILEALSLFAPGRGFRSGKFDSMLTNDAEHSHEWAAHSTYLQGQEEIKIATGYNTKSNKARCIDVAEERLKKQSDILNYLRLVWLIPQMDSIFLESASIRRKFFDRICYNLYPDHAKYIAKYEHYLSSRLKILEQQAPDIIWLDGVEAQIAKLAMAIHKVRQDVLSTLQQVIDASDEDFLKPILELRYTLTESQLNEENIKKQFILNRVLDRSSGRTNTGIHKVDFIATHPRKAISAQYCSTGEQKSMLLSIILAQTKAIKTITSIAPIILLDEALAHLDEPKQIKILEILYTSESQVWLSTTKHDIEYPAFGDSVIIRLKG